MANQFARLWVNLAITGFSYQKENKINETKPKLNPKIQVRTRGGMLMKADFYLAK